MEPSADPANSASPLVQRLRASGLIDPKQLDDSVMSLTSKGVRSDAKLAAELLQRGWITEWQLQQLRAGRTDVFFLDQGRYLLLGEIGRGGMGTVYRARHLRLNREVALKFIDPRNVTDPQALSRFRREVQVNAKLQHENIVHAYDVAEHRGVSCLVLEFVDGSDLAKLVQRDGVMDPHEVAAIACQVAAGLAYAHAQGVVHRDIKPQNILLSTSGVAKILDMGVAKLLHEPAVETQTTLTQHGSVMGTVDFMAPEQGLDTRTADHRSDIYALGATLYFLLSGQPPFAGGTTIEKLSRLGTQEPPPLSQLRPDCPRALCEAIHRMMAKRPEDRFQNADDVVRALRPLAGNRIAGAALSTSDGTPAAESARDTNTELGSDPFPFVVTEESALSALRRHEGSQGSRLTWGVVAVVAGALLAIGGYAIWQFNNTREAAKVTTDPNPSVASGPMTPRPPAAFRAEFPGHFGAMIAMALARNGRWLATGGADGQVRIWDVERERTIRTYRGHTGGVTAVAFSPDGMLIASADRWGNIHIWRTSSGELVARTRRQVDPGLLSGLEWSPAGDEIAYFDSGKIVRWSTSQKRPVWTATTPGPIVAFSTDGSMVLGGVLQGDLVVWQVPSGEELCRVTDPAIARQFIGFAGNELFVTRSADLKVQVWSARSGELVKEFSVPDTADLVDAARKIPAVELLPRTDLCLVRMPPGMELPLIQLATGEVVRQVNPKLSLALFIWPDLSRAIVRESFGDPNCLIRTLLLPSGNLGQPFGITHFPGLGIPAIVGQRYLRTAYGWFDIWLGEMDADFPSFPFVADDGSILSIVDDRVERWPPPGTSGERRTVRCRLNDATNYIGRCGWTDDGNTIWGISNDSKRICFWSPGTGEVQRIVETDSFGPGHRIDMIRGINLRGDVLAISSPQANGFLILAGDMQQPRTKIECSLTDQIRLSPDGKLLAEARDSSVFLWNTVDGGKVATLQTGILGNHWQPAILHFSPSGKYLFVTRQVWNLAGTEKLWECPEQDHADQQSFRSGCFFADEDHVLVAQDGQVQIWNWRQNKKRMTIFLMPEGQWAAVNADGNWRGSNLAFQYLRCLMRDAGGRQEWISEFEYERRTGWKPDRNKARLKIEARATP